MRVTLRMSVVRALANITQAHEQLAELGNRLATGRRLTRPSDDPAGITHSLSLRAGMKLGLQHLRNVNSGVARLSATEAALDALTQVMQRARELTVAGANDTLGASQRVTIASEITQLLDEAIAIGNTSFGGQRIFGGHQTTSAPFTPVGNPPTAVTYTGDSGVIEREVGIGVRVTVNVPGDTVLSPVHTALIDLRDHLLSNDTTAIRNTDLVALDGALENLVEIRGNLGAAANRLEITRTRLEDAGLANQQLLSDVEDADLVATIVDLNVQENVFQAALAASARSVRVTLLDFLR